MLSGGSRAEVRLFEARQSQFQPGKFLGFYAKYDKVHINKDGGKSLLNMVCMKTAKKGKMSTATCIPRRSPIQVLTGLNLA